MEHRWYRRKETDFPVRVFQQGSLVATGIAANENDEGLYIKLDGAAFVAGGKVEVDIPARDNGIDAAQCKPALVVHHTEGGFGVLFIANRYLRGDEGI